MLTRYYYSIAGATIVFVLSMFGYFYASEPTPIQQEIVTDTTYKQISVKGPIQPLPQLENYNKDWARLGKALFNSTLLSSDNSISCASCHLVAYGGDDGFPVSTGVDSQVGTRNSPTVLNAVFNFRQFWDGRSKDLAEQVHGPIHNPIEMASNWNEVISKLEKEPQFVNAFRELGVKKISPESITMAITVFEETLITPNAPIDLYLMGDKSALSAQQQRGFNKFQQFGCITCHQGRNIGGNFYQKLGRIDLAPEGLLSDFGLYERTRKESDKHVFKVPSLRNIAETAPYFHDGSVASLEEAVQIMARVQLGIDLEKEDRDDIVALLHAFTGKLEQVESL